MVPKHSDHRTPHVAYKCAETQEPFANRFFRATGMFIVILTVYAFLSMTDLLSFASVTQDAVGLGAIFLIGITASVSSCLAMVGGLLLGVSASFAEAHPTLSRGAKLRPMIQFNIGRIAGYFLLGGLTGLLGQSLIVSVKTTGIAKVILALVMVILGLHILQLIPKKYCSIPLPRKLTARIRSLSASDHYLAPILLGAATYFVPCGFTQSMQLLALASGNFWSGAAIMAIFALGTLPALLGISMASTCAGGKTGKFFYAFAGTLTVFLGVQNLESGLALSGIDLQRYSPFAVKAATLTDDQNVTIDMNGQQIVSVGVTDNGYSNNSFTVQAGMPTWIYAVAPNGLSGCLSSLVLPDYNISKSLSKGANWIGPITPTRDFAFMCSMGMFRANVHVRS